MLIVMCTESDTVTTLLFFAGEEAKELEPVLNSYLTFAIITMFATLLHTLA